MKCNFLDSNGKSHPQIMGCYGIGITRMLAAVIEESHDDKGVIFPMSIAPYEVHLCALNRRDEAVLKASDKLYEDLSAAGITVLFDDRDEKAGSQFADADLMGMPLRLTVSPRTLGDPAGPSAEIKWRDGRKALPNTHLSSLVKLVSEMVQAEYTK